MKSKFHINKDGRCVIPDGVTKIEYSAFDGCPELISVEIPDSVTEIGNYAFADCTALTSIKVPDTVTGIEENASGRCAAQISTVTRKADN